MPISNAAIGDIFNRVADLLYVKGDNPFRIRAYRNAARVIESQPKSFDEILSKNEEFPKLIGIGKDLEEKIHEIVNTGKLKLLQELERKTPKGTRELLQVESLGPNKVRLLQNKLKLRSLKDLELAARKGKIRRVEGFGIKSEEKILQYFEPNKINNNRVSLADALMQADPLTKYLQNSKLFKKVTLAGSCRRKKDTIGDLDFIAVSKKPISCIEHFIQYENIQRVLAKGTTKSSVILKSGIQVDIRVVEPESYGAALLYSTGSKEHNIALRRRAQKLGLKINEYGVYRASKCIASKSEADIYRVLGLKYIEPEKRKNEGEIEAALLSS